MNPRAGWHAFAFGPANHGAGCNDEQAPQRSLTYLGRSSEPFLAAVERWIGVSPIQAAKSHPERNVSAGGAIASSAVAISGPMPGTVISR